MTRRASRSVGFRTRPGPWSSDPASRSSISTSRQSGRAWKRTRTPSRLRSRWSWGYTSPLPRSGRRAGRPPPALPAVTAPQGIEASAIIKTLRTAHGITISGGQTKVKGKIFRLAHLGYADESDVVVCLSALERTLNDLGYPIKLGDGVRAVQEVLARAG